MVKCKRVIVVFLLFLLAGCEDDEIKNLLQSGLDKGNPTGTRGVCFIVDKIDYPYTTKYIEGDLDEDSAISFKKKLNESLNKRLAMFARLGLLSEQPAEDENGQLTGFYQYDVSDEGRKYHAYALHGNRSVFCFGHVVIDSIRGKQWDVAETQADVSYYYHVEGEIPAWATSPELSIISPLSDNNDSIIWRKKTGGVPFNKTASGLKPVIIPNLIIFGT